MSKSATDQLECDEQVRKRAQWEAFEFTLLGEGKVEVRNESYPDEGADDHTYVVEVEDGEPTNCSCPYGEYNNSACKHQVTVGIHAPVIGAVREREEACPNGDPRCGGPDADELPCFECYQQRGEAA